MKVMSPLHYNFMAFYKFDIAKYEQINAQLLLFVETGKNIKTVVSSAGITCRLAGSLCRENKEY